MRAGDTVFHRPTGETWVLAYAEDGKVSPCGWPESIALEADCELVTAASDEEHLAMLRKWADMSGGDYRSTVCRRQLWMKSKRTLLWQEDDADRAAGDNTRERIGGAWARLLGGAFPGWEAALEKYDGGDTMYHLFSGGIVAGFSYQGEFIERLDPTWCPTVFTRGKSGPIVGFCKKPRGHEDECVPGRASEEPPAP